MSIGQFREFHDDVCQFRPCGKSSLVEAVDLISCAIRSCRNQEVAKLLVNTTALTGVSVPALSDRFLMIEEWAQEAQGMVMVALVVQPELIDPRKFGVKVAQHFGFAADIFTSEPDAVKWLSSTIEAR